MANICIKYDKQIPITTNTEIFGLFINDTLSWKTHTDYIIPQWSSACYAMRSVKPYVSQ